MLNEKVSKNNTSVKNTVKINKQLPLAGSCQNY
jgi:hypothetical protein